MNGLTYDQETQQRLEDMYRPAGVVSRCAKREHLDEPIVWREVVAPSAEEVHLRSSRRRWPAPAASAEEVHLMAPAFTAFAMDGVAMVEADVAQRMATTGEDYDTASAYCKAQGLDKLREKDPAKYAAQAAFVRRMCAEMGIPVPYPFC